MQVAIINRVHAFRGREASLAINEQILEKIAAGNELAAMSDCSPQRGLHLKLKRVKHAEDCDHEKLSNIIGFNFLVRSICKQKLDSVRAEKGRSSKVPKSMNYVKQGSEEPLRRCQVVHRNCFLLFIIYIIALL